VGDEENGCSGIFAHAQIIYSPVFFMFMIFKFCLPIWSLLAVLEPLPTGISYAEILATSHSGVNNLAKIRYYFRALNEITFVSLCAEFIGRLYWPLIIGGFTVSSVA
jgi:hypothetical protein